MDAPQNIRALQDQHALELRWTDGTTCRLPYKFLRSQCPCASCVDEITGARILDPETIPEDIHPEQLALSGNYALKILWSDRHFTGLYTWDYLHELCGRLNVGRIVNPSGRI